VLSIFQQQNITSFFWLFVFIIILTFHNFIHPSIVSDSTAFQGFLFSIPDWSRWQSAHPIGYIILSLCIHAIIALYLNAHILNQKLLNKKTILPAVSYFVTLAMLPSLYLISFSTIAAWFLCFALVQLLNVYHLSDARFICFKIGLCIGVATLFYFPAILFFIFSPVLIFILRPFNSKELIIYILGFIMPFYLFVSVGYIVLGKKLFYSAPELHVQLPVSVVGQIDFILLTIVFISVLVYSRYLMLQQNNRKRISIKKKWDVIMGYVFIAALVGIFSTAFPGHTWVVFLLPFSIILSHAFQHRNEKYNTFTFVLLILIALAVQWLF
jgi:hypothetical protein